MASSSHAHHAHAHRYPPHTNPHSNSNPHPPPHVPSNDVRLPPLKSLNFRFRPLQHDAPPGPDQPAYTGFDVGQDVNGSTLSHATPGASAPTPNGTSFSAFGYSTPTPTSAPAYVHRQPFAFQGQTSSQSQPDHDTSTWQQQHPHGANPPASAHSQTPSQVHAQVPSSQPSSFARTTPLVPTTVDPPTAAPQRATSAFPAPPPKHRSTYPPPSPYTPNTSHSYTTSYTPSSSSTSAPYTPYSTSPAYTTNTTSPTFGHSTSPPYGSTPANGASYATHHAYPTPTSAYPHPPPSPTPTPTQPPQPHPHAHSPPHYVSPSTSASTHTFDTRGSTTYEGQGPAPPVRGHPQVQDTRDSRVRYSHTQPKLADARIDSRHEMYPHPPAPTSVPPSAAVDARHSQSYSQHETRPAYAHQGDSSRPATSYAQGQPPAHVSPQTQPEVARPYPPEPRTSAYTQDTKYTYPQSHAPEPPARAGSAYAQDPPSRVGYPPEGPARPTHAQDSRTGYPHGQESHGSNRGTGAPYVAETRQSSGYMSTQDTRHGYAPSEASAVPSSYVPAEQRHGPPAPPQYVPSNADQRSSFGDSRSTGAYPVANSEPSRSGYTAPDSVPIPAIVPSQRPAPSPLPASQHQLTRQTGQHGYSSYPPQHTASSYNGSPASNSQHASGAAPPHSAVAVAILHSATTTRPACTPLVPSVSIFAWSPTPTLCAPTCSNCPFHTSQSGSNATIALTSSFASTTTDTSSRRPASRVCFSSGYHAC
ncbi:hypothetical protein J3R83DRAFT_12593 [Lanmaoa asiatica]|nr:hypothetical protein J3R83DRAFT_12593 [Lanmaoa asiatica]